MEGSTDGCAIGIDFGTSKCIVAVKRRNGQTTIGNVYGDRSIAAYFGLDSSNNLTCESEVKEDLRLSPIGFVFGIKRLLKGGRSNMTNFDRVALCSLQNSESAG